MRRFGVAPGSDHGPRVDDSPGCRPGAPLGAHGAAAAFPATPPPRADPYSDVAEGLSFFSRPSSSSAVPPAHPNYNHSRAVSPPPLHTPLVSLPQPSARPAAFPRPGQSRPARSVRRRRRQRDRGCRGREPRGRSGSFPRSRLGSLVVRLAAHGRGSPEPVRALELPRLRGNPGGHGPATAGGLRGADIAAAAAGRGRCRGVPGAGRRPRSRREVRSPAIVRLVSVVSAVSASFVVVVLP